MKPLAVAVPVLVSLLVAACVTEPDEPIPSVAIEASTTSIQTYGLVTFTLSASGARIDSTTIDFGDGKREVFSCGGKTGVSITVAHQYIWKGTVTVELTAHSGRKHPRTSLQIDVALNTPPSVRSHSIDIAEGDSLVMSLSDIIRDDENDPFDYSYSVSNPGILVLQHGDSLTIRGIDEDFNGNAHFIVNYSYRMSDSLLRFGSWDIRIDIQPRDVIAGSVEDIMAGTYAGARDPSLVLKPPYTAGWVTIDGMNIPVDLTTGAFKSPKLPPKLHMVSWGGFATAAGESSFVRNERFPLGDREVTLLMHSTAGTGMSPADLRDFYREANFDLRLPGFERLYAPDYAHMEFLTDYLAASGTVIEGHTLYGLTPEQQEMVAGWLADEIDAILPPEYRIALTRGETTDSLPVVEEGGSIMPQQGTAVAFSEQTRGWVSSPVVFTNGYIIERAWIWLRDDGTPETHGISRAAALRSFLARRAAPRGVVTGTRFAGKSCLAVGGAGPAEHLTGADRKLLWLPLLHPPGTRMHEWLRLH